MASLGCVSEETPFVIDDAKESGKAAASPAADATGPSTAATQAERQELKPAEPVKDQGLPDEAFIKIANWDDDRIKLSNFIAGYIIAHGIDYPVRLVDLDTAGYQAALPIADVDVVLEMAPGWYDGHVESGDISVLGTLSKENPDGRIGVHSTLKQRAPEVAQFLEKYAPDDAVLGKLTTLMGRRGRASVNERSATLPFLKRNEEMWAQWISATAAEEVKTALKESVVSLCRKRVNLRLSLEDQIHTA